MEQLMEKMSSLESGHLSSQEFQLSVLTALEEVTRQQLLLRARLDKIVRKENREEVRHLLESEDFFNVEEENSNIQCSSMHVIDGTVACRWIHILCIYSFYYSGLFMGSEHEQIGKRGNQKKKIPDCSSQDCVCMIHANQLGSIIKNQELQDTRIIVRPSPRLSPRHCPRLNDHKMAAINKLEKIIGCFAAMSAHLMVDDGSVGCDVDGFINEDGIIMVKIIESHSRLEDRAKTEPGFCLHHKDGRLVLNRDHDYFYEVQAALEICDKAKCYFLISANINDGKRGENGEKEEFHYQIVDRDTEFWTREIVPTLESCIR